jgi:hypothetical protein
MTTQEDQPAGSPEPRDSEPPSDQPTAEPAPGAETSTTPGPPGERRLVPKEQVMDFQARWQAIQQGFVDDPRSAVGDADTLVGEVLQRLSTTFENQHQELEGQWADGEPSTEDLRGALQRYRDFFDRLLAI